jgi:esterase/lipase superfamily enzyme
MSSPEEKRAALERLQRDCPEEIERTRALHQYLREESVRRMMAGCMIGAAQERVLVEVGR